MKQIWVGGEEDFDKVMLWAAATTTFFTFCRAGEITIPEGKTYDPHANLSYEDISVDNSHDPGIISLLIKQSKTDQAREGVKVYMGKTGDDICPVKALLHFLRLRGSKAGPLFIWQDGTPLQKPQFNKAVKLALTQAQLPAEKFAGHSFRVWCSYYSCISWFRRLNHPDTWTLEELIVPSIHQAGTKISSGHFTYLS